MNLITVGNNSQEIVSTNYFESEYCDKGYYFLSSNAGAFRLLIPTSRKMDIPEMQTAKMIVISIGIHKQHNRELVEILFDDNSNNLFSLFLSIEQLDRKPLKEESNTECTFIGYSEGLHQEIRMRCGFRYVNTLPCLKPWRKE